MVREKEINVNIHIKEKDYPIDESMGEINKPKVYVDGERLDKPNESSVDTVRIKGRTLDVYYFLIQNPGFHGVRNLQRKLGHSSAGLTQYHLKRLLKVNAVITNDYGHYGIEKDEVRLGSLEDHVKIISYWVPRTIIFGSILLILGLLGALYLIFDINSSLYMIIFIATTLVLAGTLFIDSSKMISKLRHTQILVKSDKQKETEILRKRLVEAIALKNNHRAKSKFEAQKILEEVIADDIIDSELTIFAMFNLCDLLLDELKLYGQEEVINEVVQLTTKVYTIATEISSTTLSIEALLLQHKFELIKGQFDTALGKLDQAYEIADANNLLNLRKIIIREKESFENELIKWRDSDGSSMYSKIEKAKLKDYIRNMNIMKLKLESPMN